MITATSVDFIDTDPPTYVAVCFEPDCDWRSDQTPHHQLAASRADAHEQECHS